jgi:two-component system CheB/CheR fusion protein
MDGCEVCLHIRKMLGDSVFVVALTGWGHEEDRHRTREAGFDLHVVKPVEPEALMNMLAGLHLERAESAIS